MSVTKSLYVPTLNTRIYDSRGASNPIKSGEARGIMLTGPPGGAPTSPPADTAVAVSANVTVLPGGAGAGHLNVNGGPTSLVNFQNGEVIANAGIINVDEFGFATFQIYSQDGAAAHVIVDLNGYFVGQP